MGAFPDQFVPGSLIKVVQWRPKFTRQATPNNREEPAGLNRSGGAPWPVNVSTVEQGALPRPEAARRRARTHSGAVWAAHACTIVSVRLA